MDVSHQWGADLSLSPSGDLSVSTGTTYVQERALRRLMTSPLDDLWTPSYGAGLPGFVGQSVDTGRIAAVIRSQLLLEERISRDPEPAVEVSADDLGTVYASIALTLTDGTQAGLSFGMEKNDGP